MIKRLLSNLSVDHSHPAEEKLLASIDGELSGRQGARVRRHLEACWPCRASLDRIGETISLFVEFQTQIQMSATPAPPGNWSGFGGKLQRLAAAPPAPKSYWKTLVEHLNSFTASLRPSNWSPGTIRAFAGSVTMLVLAALIWQLVAVRNISAGELLDNALASERVVVEAVSQAVVYRRLSVRRSDGKAFDWEVWRDASRGRYRQSVTDGNFQRRDAETQSLQSILKLNRMNALEPLSAESFRAWRDSLSDKSDQVTRTTAQTGENLVSLITNNNFAKQPGEISQATLNVREADWHPVGAELRVKNNEGEEIYTLAELEFRVVNLSQFRSDFFDNAITPQIAEAPLASPNPSANSNISPETTAPPIAGAPVPQASAEDEIEVLQILNQVKADLGEQINVTRENGLLYIRGVVETAQRKKEILAALAAKANNPAIKIEIETNAEALARVAKQRSNSSVETITGDDTTGPATEDELVKKFGSQAAARAFSAQMVGRSRSALSHAYALKRLAGQFSTEELREMKPEPRAKWLGLIAQHAAAFRSGTSSLQSALEDVFGSQGGGAASAPAVGDWTDVPRAVERLVDLASANDAVIRSAFAVSSGGAQVSAVKTAQFWSNLRSAEALAARLAAVK